MDFSLSAEQQAIRDAVAKICARFGDDYWLKKDKDGGFPDDFHRAFAEAGWLGVCMPQEYGGAGLGVTEAALLMQTIAESGAGMSGASALHMNIFGLNPVVVFGSDEQKRRALPPLIAGKDKACFAVTEPNVGLDTLKLKTKAVRDGDRYILSGQKIWISTAQVTNKMLILARTTPLDEVSRRTEGLSLFYTDLDRRFVDVREIPKMGRSAVELQRAVHRHAAGARRRPDRRGGQGLRIHPARHESRAHPDRRGGHRARPRGVRARPPLTPRSASCSTGRSARTRRSSIRSPRCWMQLEAANLMAFKAASLYDAGEPCGVEANAAKYLAGEAVFKACETALMTHGGMGYAKEFHVERYLARNR